MVVCDPIELLACALADEKVQSALAGAHVGTLPFKVLDQMFNHPLTDKGLATFLADWKKAQGAG